MLMRLLAAFILVPLVELYLLFRLADATGPLLALSIVVLTGIIGSILAKNEGIRALSRFQTAASEGRMPSKEIQDGLMIIFAAALLLTPGILTDTLGFTLLLPMGREFMRRHVLSRMLKGVKVNVTSSTNADAWQDGAPFDPHDRKWQGKTVEGRVVQDRSP